MVLHIFIYITITIFIIQLNYLFQGKHNVPNALSCTALYDSYELNKMSIKSTLKKYKGVRRRCDNVGEDNSASFYEDYGHHPTEVKATAFPLKNKIYKKLKVVF